MFIIVMCSKKMYYHCKNESQKLHCVDMNIFASASTSLHPYSSKFQDFPRPKSLSRTFQVLEILPKKSRNFQEEWEPWWHLGHHAGASVQDTNMQQHWTAAAPHTDMGCSAEHHGRNNWLQTGLWTHTNMWQNRLLHMFQGSVATVFKWGGKHYNCVITNVFTDIFWG